MRPNIYLWSIIRKKVLGGKLHLCRQLAVKFCWNSSLKIPDTCRISISEDQQFPKMKFFEQIFFYLEFLGLKFEYSGFNRIFLHVYFWFLTFALFLGIPYIFLLFETESHVICRILWYGCFFCCRSGIDLHGNEHLFEEATIQRLYGCTGGTQKKW